MKLTVQPGDTLGRLTQLALNQAAPDAGGGRLPFSQLMQKVQAVAAQNQITDPDRIFPGQVIDFSTALSVPATRQGGVSNNAAEPMAP
ncbi:MAG: LysM peptidoglycan-binding domain-containing protein, partial [Burkholderiaceae bacterium]